MTFVVPSIVKVLMNKIASWISIRANDWTVGRAIIASNECHINSNLQFVYMKSKRNQRNLCTSEFRLVHGLSFWWFWTRTQATIDLLEFSLNGSHWIQSKTGLVTKALSQLATNTLPEVIILRAFPLLSLVWCLLPLTTLNSYQTRDSNGNFIFTTAWRNISVVRYGLSLVTILLLNLVKIHWVQ